MAEMETVTIRSLVGAAQAELAAKCFGSLERFAQRPVRWVLHDDGTLAGAAREHLQKTLRGDCVFVDRAEATAVVREQLTKHPHCARFRDEHIFGPKLFDVPILAAQRLERAVYTDSDILWTRPADCPAYFSGENCPRNSFVVMRDLKESYAVRLRHWSILQRNGARLVSRFCAGMMSFDPVGGGYDLDYIEYLLALDARTGLFDGFRFWAEQTIYAALAARAGNCAWIEPKMCVVAHWRNFAVDRDAAIIHFAGTSRALFADRYAAIDFDESKATAVLGTQPAPLCNLVRRLVSAVRVRCWLTESNHSMTAKITS